MHADDEEDAFIMFKTTETKCDEMYNQGVQLKASGYVQEALKCFLECAKQMRDTQYSKRFPQTLREIAELYRSLQLHEKAAEFVKAELFFYDTLLNGPQYQDATCFTDSPEDTEALVRRADEYEKMAQLNRSQNKHTFALECCGRAVRLRQAIFGTENELTHRTMEYFGMLYNENEKSECVERAAEEKKAQSPHVTLTPPISEGVSAGGGLGNNEYIQRQTTLPNTNDYSSTEQGVTQEHGAAVMSMHHRPFNLAPVWLIFVAVVLQVLVVLYVL